MCVDFVVGSLHSFLPRQPTFSKTGIGRRITNLFTAISRKVVGKNVHATIPKGSMGYEQDAVPDTVAIEPTLLLSFSNRKHMSVASRAILSNFFERTVNSKPPTIPFGIVACTFSDNLSRNSCMYFH